MVVTSTAAGIAAEVVERMKAAGLSQAEVARQTGIPPMTLNRKVRALVPFNVAELAALAELFGTTASSLTAAAESRVA